MQKKKKASAPKKHYRFLQGKGAIYSALDTFSAFIYRKAENGAIGSVLTAYDRENNAFHSGFLAHIASRLQFSKKIKHAAACGCEQSAILTFFDRFFHMLAGLRLRFYGVLFGFFGLVSLLGAAYESFKYDFQKYEWGVYITAVALLLIGLILFLSKRHLSEAMQENRMMNFILFSVIGARKTLFDEIKETKGSLLAAALIGILLGGAAYVLSPLLVLIALFGILALYTVLIIPEFGVVCIVFGLSFLPTMLLVAMVSYTFLCYMLKLWRGKRTFRFSLLDCMVMLFLLFMAAGGIASVAGGDSVKPALVYICFMLGYFLAVNLIRSNAWINRCLAALLLGCFLVAGYGVYENYFGSLLTIWQDTDMFGDIAGRVTSTFGNPNVLGEYLIMAIPFAFAVLLSGEKKSGRFFAFMTFCAACACLVFTWSRGAWLGFIFTMFLFFLVYTRKTLILCLCGVFAVPFLPFVLPDSILYRITSIGNISDSSTSYRVGIWEASVNAALDFAGSGVGVGTEAFTKVYPLYALSGIEIAPHAHNLFLQTAIETGLPGLLILLLIIVLFMQSAFTFYKKCKSGDMKRGKLLALAGFSGIMGVLLQGMTDYIWYNYRVFLMFWVVMGLTAAIQRVALETDRNESVSLGIENEGLS
ncbi:MAG: hypothetical protein HFE78_02070 [Clostridiales bacterium]|nr:hypothetical protein [Clostridiales bacterium]